MEVSRGRYVFLRGNFPLCEIFCLQQAKEKPSETHWLKDDESEICWWSSWARPDWRVGTNYISLTRLHFINSKTPVANEQLIPYSCFFPRTQWELSHGASHIFHQWALQCYPGASGSPVDFATTGLTRQEFLSLISVHSHSCWTQVSPLNLYVPKQSWLPGSPTSLFIYGPSFLMLRASQDESMDQQSPCCDL